MRSIFGYSRTHNEDDSEMQTYWRDVVRICPLTTGNMPQQKNFPFHEIHSSPPLFLSLGVRKYVARGPGGGARVERKGGRRTTWRASERARDRTAEVSGRAGRRGLRLRSDQPNAKTMSIHERAVRTTSRSRQKGSEIECDANAVIESLQIYGVHYARRPQWCCYST